MRKLQRPDEGEQNIAGILICLWRWAAPVYGTFSPKIIMAGLWQGWPGRQVFGADGHRGSRTRCGGPVGKNKGREAGVAGVRL